MQTRQQEFSDRTVERLDAMVENLQAENTRLRATLTRIADHSGTFTNSGLRELCRAALDGEQIGNRTDG